jgi:hypothetical protein
VIERTSDTDAVSFTSASGTISLAADVATKGPMLDLKLDLRDSAGVLLASADTSSLGESLSFNLASAGTYYVTVASHGSYGDVGQYTLHGTVVSVAAVTPLPGDVNLDGAVDFTDVTVLSQNYNQTTMLGWSAGDFNGDGVVDFYDLTVLAQNYNRGVTGSGAGALATGTDGSRASATSVEVSAAEANATRLTPARRPVARFSRALIARVQGR